MNTKKSYEIAVQALSQNIAYKVKDIPSDIVNDIQEIRLRVKRPISFCTGSITYFLTENGSITTEPSGKLLTVDKEDIRQTFTNLCNYSVFSKQNEIRNGFITIRGGSRAGICGTAVTENNSISNIRDIGSINIRVASERIGCCDDLLSRMSEPERGFLLCGAPCSGKTTILRDVARCLSINHNVAVIDSRSELAGTYMGEAQNDIGMCDVLDGYSKSDGFDHAVRCLSPEIVVCDEIGDELDARSVENATGSGVAVIASAHCSDKDEFMRKHSLLRLIENHAFNNIVFLKSRREIGRIGEIVTCDELLR
ncbi:MAG: stage III sporulation protein AA [Ruminococcus sp.]|nr:stage III sporulation protein AA [Ruminococcus sp.]